ncbi:MAG: helix-turn-helix domain-containing protein [Atopobiaceae bacterium]|nr:helix-turn-helix domain-containing protein [Atopobiaceae bacterium]
MSRTKELRNNYTYEQKLAAVKDHLENGKTVEQSMKDNGITSRSAFFRWCGEWKTQGPEALRPKRRGRPPKSK